MIFKKNLIFVIAILMQINNLNCRLITNRNLLIFNENGDSENISLTIQKHNPTALSPEGFGAISSNFLVALYQEPGVIIVSKAVVENILDHSTFFNSTNPKIENVDQKLIYEKCSQAPFDKYIIKKIIINPDCQDDYSYFLLIPQSYLKLINPNYVHQVSNQTKPINSTNEPIEAALGIKFNHYPDVALTDKFLTESKKIAIQPQTMGSIKKNASCKYNFLDLMNQIFIKKTEAESNIWAIYLIGHGDYSENEINNIKNDIKQIADNIKMKNAKINKLSIQLKNYTNNLGLANEIKQLKHEIGIDKQNINKRFEQSDLTGHANKIAGFLINEFQDLLKFFNNNISTGFLFYTSCFSGGVHFVEPYKDLTEDYPLTFNYAIASDTIAENPSSTSIMHYKHFLDDPLINFNKFFDGLSNHSDKPLKYEQLFSYIVDFLGRSSPTAASAILAGNIPSIRFPGTSWFSVVDLDKRVLELTNIKILTQENRPLKINAGNQTIDAILLYAQNIPFKLNIYKKEGAQNLRAIISMIPGKAKHNLNQISAPKFKINEIIGLFFPFVSKLESSKFFYIKELFVEWEVSAVIFNDVIIIINGELPKESVLNINKLTGKINIVFFKYKNKIFTKQWQVEDEMLFFQVPEDFTKINAPKYLEILESSFGPIQELETEHFSGFIRTSSGKKEVTVEPIKKALELKIKKIKLTQYEEKLNQLLNLSAELGGLKAAKKNLN